MIIVLFFLLLILANPLTVKAYIDPGTGSFIIQAIVASIAVTALYTKLFWKKIEYFFRHFLNKNKNEKTKSIQSDEHEQQH